MSITLFGVVLFVHIGLALTAFAMAGIVHAAMPAMARGTSVAQMRPWAAILHRLEPLFPLVAVGLLGLGLWLVHLGAHTDDQFSYSDGWVVTAIVTLVVIEAVSGALLAPQAKRLVALIDAAGDGAVPDDIRSITVDRRIWDIGHVATFGFVGVVFLMAAKPTGWVVVLPPVIGALVGLALSSLQLGRLRVGATSASLPEQRQPATETPVIENA